MRGKQQSGRGRSTGWRPTTPWHAYSRTLSVSFSFPEDGLPKACLIAAVTSLQTIFKFICGFWNVQNSELNLQLRQGGVTGGLPGPAPGRVCQIPVLFV